MVARATERAHASQQHRQLGRPRYPARMTDRTPDQPAEGLVIEFPDDPLVSDLPDASDMHATTETEEPPDTHDIRERWARLADIGAGG